MISKGKGKLKWERDMPRDIEEKLEVTMMVVMMVVAMMVVAMIVIMMMVGMVMMMMVMMVSVPSFWWLSLAILTVRCH